MFRSSSTHVRLAWAAFAALMAVAIAWSLNRAPAPPVTAAKAPSTAPPTANLKTVALTKPAKKSAKKPGKAPKSGPAAQFESLKATKAPKRKFRPREVLVTFADGASASERKALRASVGATSHEDLGANTEKLVLPKGVSTKDAAAALSASPNVTAADRNAVYRILVAPNDALYADQWSLNNGFDTDIDAEEGWAASSTSTTPVTVAVVDTGIDYSHPDLVNQVWTNAGEFGSGKQTNGLDDDGNGLVDDWRGYDFYNGDNNATDDNAHGTHVSGIIAAQRGNSTGIAGVSSQAKILPLKVFGAQGYGDDAAILKAFQYAVAKGAKVVNGSFGGSYNSNVVSQYVQSQTGTTFVFAAGNDAKSLDTGDSFPCEIPGNHVVCVGATDVNGQSAVYSDYSTTQVDLVAPGSSVLSTVPTALVSTGYAKFNGTSMASPTVAGATAVLVSKFPTLTPAQLRTRLMSTVDPALTPGKSASGRLNLAGAIANAPVAYSATGSASVSAGRVTYTAAAGGLNTVTVLASGSTVTVEDTGVTTLTPGTGCTTVTAKKVSCGSITAVTINSGDLGDTITADIPLPVTVSSGTGPSVIKTGAGADTITGGDEVDDVDPGDGNDTITLAGGNDRVFRSGSSFPAADGNDTIYAGAGNDYIYDNVGSNVVYGGAGDDSFSYSINPSQNYGEDGNDVFSVLGDGHTVNGGNGNDWIWVDPGHNRSFTGGAGTDMVAYAEYDTDVQVVLGGSSLNGTEGDNDTIAADVEDAMGGRGEDVLYGSSGPNRLIGGIGDDGVYGNGGDDVLDQWLDGYENELNAPGATGTDVLYGGTGIDTVTYQGPQGDEIFGAPAGVNASIDGIANDVLEGYPGPDNISTTVENLTGTTEDDTLTGNGFANVLIGGGGNDVLAGLGGTDSYVGDRPGGCAAFCTDGTKDAVTYANQTGPITASLDGLANDGASGEVENIPASIEKLIGSSAADTLTAGSASATLVGGPGADTLRGGASNDILIANDGVVDAVLECKGGSGDYILKDATDVANADCESVTTSDAPQTTITSGPETGSYVSTSPTFTFTSDKAGSTFECADDTTTAGAYFPCTSPWKTAQRANGDVRVYKIRAKSSTGVVDTSPEMFAIWYDTVAPDTTITGGPAYGSTVLTNTVSIPFTSTGETVTYECQYDLGTWNACTSPFTTPTLTAGEHELRFRTKDAVGNRGAQIPLQFKRESQLLTVPGGAIPVGTFNLTSSGGGLTSSLDWIHWGSTAPGTFERKNATQRISTWTGVGTGTLAPLTGPNQYTWTDALVAPASATTQVGISRQLSNGGGFKFSVPANNGETRKLRVFVGVRGSATVGTLSVRFGTQAPVTQTLSGSGGASATTVLSNVFTIDYRPFAPTDTLNVEFKQTAGGTATGTAVLLYAAALY